MGKVMRHLLRETSGSAALSGFVRGCRVMFHEVNNLHVCSEDM